MRTPKEQINGEQHGQHSDRVALTSDRGGAGSSFLLKCKCGAVSHGGSESGNDEDSEFELHVVGGYEWALIAGFYFRTRLRVGSQCKRLGFYAVWRCLSSTTV
jgi:hypothetical protein